MKTKIFIVSIVSIALLGLAACSGVSTQAEPRTISVNGTGVVVLSPDMAEVNIGVQTESDDAEEASAANTQQVEAIMAALQEFEIPDSDIQTAYFSIYPRQNFDGDNQVSEITYVVNNSLLVTVRDLDKLGDVLDAAIAAGANSINGITFDVSDREGAYAQALETAMQNAESRADVLAQAANASIVQVQSVNSFIAGGGEQRQYAEVAAMDEMAVGGSSVPVSPGEMEIRVEVNVVYEIK